MLDYLKENIPKKGFTRLYPALDWVMDHQHQREPVVLCHGDFHADNILWHKGKVSAVLDWGTFRFEEPVYDVARQIISGYAFLPIARPMIDCQDYIERYYRKYLAISQVDSDKVKFYKSLQCLYCFFAYENGVEPYGIPQVQNGLIETFKNLTGIVVPYLSR
jgi:aminoglycoside phosphotransferase family enzyme